MVKCKWFLSVILGLVGNVCLVSMAFAQSDKMVARHLLSHKATYDIALEQVSSGANLAYLRGVAVSTLKQNCQNWEVTQNLSTLIGLSNGQSIQRVADMEAVEVMDGSSYRFSYKEVVDEKESFSYAGTVEEENATFTIKGEKVTFPLVKGTVFPTQHMIYLLEKAMAKDKNGTLYLFDGTEVDGSLLTSYFILPSKKAAPVGIKPEFFGDHRYVLILSYYRATDETSIPLYEVRYVLTETGVIEDMLMDYGDYKVSARLTGVELLKNKVCGR